MNAQTIVINLEAEVPGTVIFDQFTGHGVTFGQPSLQPVIATVSPSQLPEGTQVLDISTYPARENPVADQVDLFRYQGSADLETDLEGSADR